MTTAIILNTGATEMVSDYLENNEIVLVVSANNEWTVYFKLSTQKCRTKIFNGFYPIEKPRPENINNAKPKVITFNADYSELLTCLKDNNVFCDDSQLKGDKKNMQIAETETNLKKSSVVITELLKAIDAESNQTTKKLGSYVPTAEDEALAQKILEEKFQERSGSKEGPLKNIQIDCPDKWD
jgi:hypothetical protein